jgi:hypothetical protein
LFVVDSLSEGRTRKAGYAYSIRGLDVDLKDLTNPVILLEKCQRTGNRMSAAGKRLNQVFHSLIQNLQKLNQKVK